MMRLDNLYTTKATRYQSYFDVYTYSYVTSNEKHRVMSLQYKANHMLLFTIACYT